jgi:hypothetical protein
MTATPRHTPEYYRERATECERLADKAGSAEIREIMLYLAMRWQVLAAEPDSNPESLPPSPK